MPPENTVEVMGEHEACGQLPRRTRRRELVVGAIAGIRADGQVLSMLAPPQASSILSVGASVGPVSVVGHVDRCGEWSVVQDRESGEAC